MRSPEKVQVEYVGYRHPDTMDELDLEICGLKTAIAAVNQRIAALEQSKKLYTMGLKNEKTVEKGPSDNQVKQTSPAGLEQARAENEEEDKE